MTNTEYLSQIGILSRRIQYHAERILRLRRDAESISSRWGECSFAHTAEAPYVRLLEKIETLQEEVDTEIALLARLQEQAEEAINALPEENLRLVLLYRYLEGKNFVQTAELLYVNRNTAMRWEKKALSLLSLPDDAIDIASSASPKIPSETCGRYSTMQHAEHCTPVRV